MQALSVRRSYVQTRRTMPVLAHRSQAPTEKAEKRRLGLSVDTIHKAAFEEEKNGDTMHMLFPFRRVCASFVDLRPFGVISLGCEQRGMGCETSDQRGVGPWVGGK